MSRFEAGDVGAAGPHLGGKTRSLAGKGWVSLPPLRPGRWTVPRAPRSVARRALRIYQPVTLRARATWEATLLLAGTGGLRLMQAVEPPERVLDAVADRVRPGGYIAVAATHSEKRFVILIMDPGGAASAVVKVAMTPEGSRGLAREAEMIGTLGPLLRAPLRAPAVLEASDGMLVLEAVQWRRRARPWVLPHDVASALGGFFRRGRSGSAGPAHGDCAPWNLLRTDEGYVLLDWEEARPEAEAFHDLFHYLVQAHALVGRPTNRSLTAGFNGDGWVADAIRSYAESSGLDPSGAKPAFASFLRTALGRYVADAVEHEGGWLHRRTRNRLGALMEQLDSDEARTVTP